MNDRANYERQQELMRKLPRNIGRVKRHGKMTPLMVRRENELRKLERALPQMSQEWQALYHEDVAKRDRLIADQRADRRRQTLERLAETDYAVGDKVVLVARDMLTGGLFADCVRGTVKIGVSGQAYVAARGRQYKLFGQGWTKLTRKGNP